jgi:hypothetical protein
MLTIAIDPGAGGGMAAQMDDNPVVVYKMPDTPKDIYDLLVTLVYHPCIIPSKVKCRVVMESISMGLFAPGGEDAAKAKMVAMFKLHRHCGQLEGFLLSLGTPFESVSPQKWMKSLGPMPKDTAKRKNHIKDMMQRRHPHIKVTLWNADALGILTWAQERNRT